MSKKKTKVCTKCEKRKKVESFVKDKSREDGLYPWCKTCHKEYREKNKEKLSVQSRKYYQENKKTIKRRAALWNKNNKEKRKKIVNKHQNTESRRKSLRKYNTSEKGRTKQRDYKKNPEYQEKAREYRSRPEVKKRINNQVRERRKTDQYKKKQKVYQKKRIKEDLNYRLRMSLRGRLYKALNGDKKTGSAVRDLGCTIPELKAYLESLWLPGMNWDNWTTDGWHIDHIKPLSSFDLTDREQFLEACHYTNLQPLWWQDNFSKGAKQ